MRILLINWQDPENPLAGGAEVHLHEIFRRLVASGHQVTWVASGWAAAPPRAELDGIEIRRTGSRYTFGLTVPVFVRRALRGGSWDVVVEALNKVPVYTPLWAPGPRVLLVHHLFGRTAFAEAPAPLAALTWLQERPIGRVYRGVPVQAISRSTAADLVGRGLHEADIEVIHPGVDLSFFRPAPSPGRAPEPTFLYLGRLQRYKRVDLIVQAFARVRHEEPSARLIVAGRGDQEAPLRRLAAELGVEDGVSFSGFVTEEEKRELFRQAWANVFVSPKEGWGITNLEAAACGTATIASDAPGLRESVIDQRTGLLVPHGDVQALAEAMLRLARDRGTTEALGAAALDFAADFTWERAAELTAEHLRRAASTREQLA